jgi:hypothetical protein
VQLVGREVKDETFEGMTRGREMDEQIVEARVVGLGKRRRTPIESKVFHLGKVAQEDGLGGGNHAKAAEGAASEVEGREMTPAVAPGAGERGGADGVADVEAKEDLEDHLVGEVGQA